VTVAAPGEGFVLALDLGTSACKVDLISELGEIVGREAEPVPTDFVDNGGAEQDAQACWGTFVRCAQRLIGRALVPPGAIVAVCAATHGLGTIPVDRSGTPLHPALIWLDARGRDYSRRLVAGVPSVQGYGLAKLLRWVRLTGGAPA